METILFITTNAGKVGALQRKLPKGYKLVQKSIELPELQANSAGDVSLEKAKEAYKILKKPLIVQDSSFHINALHGFPGAYIKYVLATIGLEGILQLLKNQSDRSYYFEGAITYIKNEHEHKTFVWKSKPGTIAKEINIVESDRAWSKLWYITIPYGHSITLAELTHVKKHENYEKGKTEFELFIDWLAKKSNTDLQ